MTPTYIFVIGTGRTGTTFLSDLLNEAVQDCYACHEPRRTIKLMSNMHLSGRVDRDQMRRYLVSHRKRVDRRLAKENATVYLQCDPWAYGFTSLLEEVFDSPYVIHAVRHPYTHIPSHMNRWYREEWVGWFRDHIPFWRLRPYRTGDMSREEWNDIEEAQRVAWYWSKINGYIEENSGNITNFMRVHYESLFSPDHQEVKRVFRFCGLDIDPEKVDEDGLDRNAASMKFSKADEWSEQLQETIFNQCHPLMELYGYKR